MKTRNKNTKIRKTKKRNNHTRKMKGGLFNWFKGVSKPENKDLNEDLKTFSTHKETIRKTMQDMYDTAKDKENFNHNYTLFTTAVSQVNEIVKQINKHRIQNTGSNPSNTGSNPSNIGAIGVGAGVVAAGAEAVAGIEGARKEIFGSPKLNSG